MKGYIQLSREAMALAASLGDEYLGLYCRIASSVAFKQKFYKGVKLEAGELGFSYRDAVAKFYQDCNQPPSHNTVKQRILKLSEVGLIELTDIYFPGTKKVCGTKLSVPKFGTDPGTHPGTHPGTTQKRNKEERKRKDTPSRRKPPDEKDIEVATWFYETLLEVNPKESKPNLDSWANEIRLLRKNKSVSHAEVRSMWRQVRDDDFWHKNILSPSKLRKQWDQLIHQGFRPVDPDDPRENYAWMLQAWAYDNLGNRIDLKPQLRYGPAYQIEPRDGYEIDRSTNPPKIRECHGSHR